MNNTTKVDFRGLEYHADQSIAAVDYTLEGSTDEGWRITRNNAEHLELGPGYRLLRTRRCGVCSTDLDRHNLPFPLPQIIGHEIVAQDRSGNRYVVEINASHAARAVESDCVYCQSGLDRHCPDRLVLGIHGLPGGFGPFVLAPIANVIALPDSVPDDCAVLIEPFAAALRAVDRINPRSSDVLGVLGTRRLGQLVIAALAARRRHRGEGFRIHAISRHASLRDLALELGADNALPPPDDGPACAPTADVIVDTTASPDGLVLATAMAEREVHLKSTHGQPSAGLRHLTELVVDEISLARAPIDETHVASTLTALGQYRANGRALVAWLAGGEVPKAWSDRADITVFSDPASAQITLSSREGELPAADVAVVDDARSVDLTLRPHDSTQLSVVRPTGEIWIRSAASALHSESPLVAAIAERGLRLSSSRCGSFRDALLLLEGDAELRTSLRRLITHRFPASALEEAFRTARGRQSIKVLVDHIHPTDGDDI